jgi:Arc/MetJ-type ribon-helix-helix transcriptional regulator
MPRKDPNSKLVLISVHIPKRILDTVDDLVRQGILPNRSEAIRMAIIMMLERAMFKNPEALPKKEEDPIEKEFKNLILKGR